MECVALFSIVSYVFSTMRSGLTNGCTNNHSCGQQILCLFGHPHLPYTTFAHLAHIFYGLSFFVVIVTNSVWREIFFFFSIFSVIFRSFRLRTGLAHQTAAKASAATTTPTVATTFKCNINICWNSWKYPNKSVLSACVVDSASVLLPLATSTH